MKSTKPYFKHQRNTDSHDRRKVPPKAKPTAAHTKEVPGTKADPELSDIRTTARDYSNPMDYQHPYPCMKRLAELLALQYDANRTRHAYCRQVRLIHEHFACDPANLTEAQLREYFLFVKLTKHWKPKTIRQAVAAARMCFEQVLGRTDWTLLSQIRTKDHDTLPPVLTREQVHLLLDHIRLRRYRTPLKLIYCCGLRLSECLALTIHDILGKENKLLIRNSKGSKDRVVPLPTPMWKELQRYWKEQRRALWAITRCRTAALGWRAFACDSCKHTHFAYHSCNHKACPQCGKAATRRWIERELSKRVDAPYFMVTFTVPEQLRSAFFGPHAKTAYDLLFAAAASSLSEKLADQKDLQARFSGFTMILHTWNQRLLFHPHLHCLVPGAGLNAQKQPVRVPNPAFLLHLPHLRAAFREHMRRLLDEHQWQVDPQVWSLDWGVHIRPVGSGHAAIKYLGTYVARSAISDSRILRVDAQNVTFRWKDRADGNRPRELSLPGIEFVTRYLRHVLPRGLRSVRYYGFCHPSAKANRLRVQFHSGLTVDFGAPSKPEAKHSSGGSIPQCPCCGGLLRILFGLPAPWKTRGPPSAARPAKGARTGTPIAA